MEPVRRSYSSMNAPVRFLFAAVIVLLATGRLKASPVIFVVRHAEKLAMLGNDPNLSPAGQKRAEALARMLKDANIMAIFTSQFKRTQETAAPLAKATNVTSTSVAANDLPQLIQKLREGQGNALVVGHGDTIPQLMKMLGINEAVQIPDNDYGELFVVSMTDKPQLLRLHYPF
ncbi:MAG: histidine phosphatase family protein [Verrucomicrobia bacterium]|nr:histidine phosphatase family protein [Verrucomicrobiota bacterium]